MMTASFKQLSNESQDAIAAKTISYCSLIHLEDKVFGTLLGKSP